MHTLAELDPKAGDDLLYQKATAEFEQYTVLKRTDTHCLLGWEKNNGEWWSALNSGDRRWMLKPKETKVTAEYCQNPCYTLAELNPKAGDVVVYWSNLQAPTEWLFESQTDCWWNLRSCEDGYLWKICLLPNNRVWTLKPQSKEKQVTVAELNLSVGDRVTDGKREGTVTNVFGPLYSLLWDWCDKYQQVAKTEPAPFTKLPKPEPTLADLNLKMGDPVLNTRNNRFALVSSVCDCFVTLRYCDGETLTLVRTEPLSRLKKLEVPE